VPHIVSLLDFFASALSVDSNCLHTLQWSKNALRAALNASGDFLLCHLTLAWQSGAIVPAG